MVAGHLDDTNDVLKLRQTCKKFTGPAFDIIKERCKVIYVHSSLTSLRTLRKICNHPLAENVEEVVLLTHVPRKELEKKFDDGIDDTWELKKRFTPWPAHLDERTLHKAELILAEWG